MRLDALMLSAAALLLIGADTTTTPVDIIALLREFGFPIFVCLWFMWRLEKRLDRFTESIEKLYNINTVLLKAVDESHPMPLPPAPGPPHAGP